MTALVPNGVKIAQALFDACYPYGRLVSHSETVWSSATFSGVRDSFTIRFDGPGCYTFAETLVEQIAAAEISVPGRLVVDITTQAIRLNKGSDLFAEVDVAVLTLDQEAFAA